MRQKATLEYLMSHGARVLMIAHISAVPSFSPLMNQLQEGFPKAQMMVCGVLGPKSNAHGPNEFLHVPYGKKLTAAVAQVMAACP